MIAATTLAGTKAALFGLGASGIATAQAMMDGGADVIADQTLRGTVQNGPDSLVLLGLDVARVGWHLASPLPHPLGGVPAWQRALARATHRGLYLLIVAVPLSGWIGSAASGIDVVLFDRWTLPRIAPLSEAWTDGAFLVHGVLTKLLAALVVLHIAGALKRRDGTLRRMLRGAA